MPRYAYVNGRYVPFSAAAVHVEDRGFQFADSVYEVIPVSDGALIELDPHLDRLDRSLAELDMTPPASRRAMKIVIGELLRREHIRDGLIYMQVTRGVAPRDHAFPNPERRGSLVILAKRYKPLTDQARFERGKRVISVPETRWRRVDIKTTALIGNVLARQAAIDAGADEAWFVDDRGYVTEGASSNAWIVTGDGTIVTHPADGRILAGITRETVIGIATTQGLKVDQRPFTIAEAQDAREAFLTSAGNAIAPVVALDDKTIGGGMPGAVAKQIHDRFDASSHREYV